MINQSRLVIQKQAEEHQSEKKSPLTKRRCGSFSQEKNIFPLLNTQTESPVYMGMIMITQFIGYLWEGSLKAVVGHY